MAGTQAVTLAVLGCGRFGRRHLDVLSRMPGVRVMAVADVDMALARQTAFKFGVPHYTTDCQEAIELPGVNAVDVCLPTFLHREAVVRAARHGRHVFCEKPLALAPHDATEAVEACRESGVKLQVGFCRRFDNAWLAAASVIRSGALGRPVIWRHATGTSGAPQPWFFEREQGGGPFVDGAIHWYDFGRFLFGEVESVRASTQVLQAGRTAPDTGVVSVRFASGDEMQLMWSWGLPSGLKVDELHEALGPEGVLSMRPRPPEPDHAVAGGAADHDGAAHAPGAAVAAQVNGVDPGSLGFLWLLKPDHPGGQPVPYQRNDMVEAELAAFIEAIRQDREPEVGGREAVAALEIAMAVLEAGQTGRTVRPAGAASLHAGANG